MSSQLYSIACVEKYLNAANDQSESSFSESRVKIQSMFSRVPHYPLDLAKEPFQITEDMKVQGMCRAALLNRTQVHTFHKNYSEDHSSLPPTLTSVCNSIFICSLIIDHMVIHFSCLYGSKILNINFFLERIQRWLYNESFTAFCFVLCVRESKKRACVHASL